MIMGGGRLSQPPPNAPAARTGIMRLLVTLELTWGT